MQQVDDDRQHRRRVQDAHHPRCRRGLDRRRNRCCRDLGADQHTPGRWQRRLQAPPHMVDGHRRVRAGADGNLVLAAIVDDDQRHAGRFAGEHSDIADVDTLPDEFGQRGDTRVVGADCADQSHGDAGARRRNGGVGTLAAAVGLQPPTDHRLARTGQPWGDDDEVDVDRRRPRRPLATGYSPGGGYSAAADTSTRASLNVAPPARSAR